MSCFVMRSFHKAVSTLCQTTECSRGIPNGSREALWREQSVASHRRGTEEGERGEAMMPKAARRIALTAALAIPLAWSGEAARSDNFCVQVQAIIADAPNSFAAFRGQRTRQETSQVPPADYGQPLRGERRA
jgi:hypothetical protein